MIVSHRHQFIFIKNGKTGSTSIEVFLSPICAASDIFTPIYPPIEGHRPRNDQGFYNRMTSAEIRERLGQEIWKRYYKFCVERNPWDKAVSYYYMARHRAGGHLSLDEYLAGDTFPVNYPRYTEPDNRVRIIVDRIIDYDGLTEGLGEVFQRVGVPFDGSLGVFAKSEYRTDRRGYQQILNPLQMQRIGEIFAVEIELHGYRFNGLVQPA